MAVTTPNEQSPWESDSVSAGQESSATFRNTMVHYSVHNSLPYLEPAESNAHTLYSLNTNLELSSHLRLGLSGSPFPSGFPKKIV
jgi:hypothetical protein